MNKKTIIIMCGSVIGLLILLLIVIWLMSILSNRYYSYEAVEEKIIEATDKYYKNNPSMLPVGNAKYNLQYSTLVENDYIKPLNELIKDGDNCTADIIVINNDGVYTYIPKLSCGESYESKELYKQVLLNNEIKTTGSGLYQGSDGSYYFRGKVNNNYVAFGEYEGSRNTEEILWQIISIEPDNTIRMKSLVHAEERTPFDDRFNEATQDRDGYNDFKNSLLKDYLIDLDKKNLFLSETQKSKLVSKNICSAKRSETDDTKDGSTECSEKTEESLLFSTMYPYEFMRASLDENCKNILDRSCSNFNYLSSTSGNSEWSVTADPVNNKYVYEFIGDTYDLGTAKSEKYVYPVVTLNEYAFYKSGSGTESDPYRLFKKSTN